MTYLMYVDESGDPGFQDPSLSSAQGPSVHYILSGLIVSAADWRNCLSVLVDIRRNIKRMHKIPMRVELKGSTLINPRGNSYMRRLNRRRRIGVYSYIFDEFVVRMPSARIINVYADKQRLRYRCSANDLERTAWLFLIQRFDNFLFKQNTPSYGLICADQTNEAKVRRLLRQMRVFNPVPIASSAGGCHHIPVTRVMEDPIIRDSTDSYFIQFCDLVAHSLYRKMHPKGSYRRYGVEKLFDKLDPILLKSASRSNSQGIVFL
ncbi:MAG: DUF3800 domain-containing protein [Thermus sp.]